MEPHVITTRGVVHNNLIICLDIFMQCCLNKKLNESPRRLIPVAKPIEEEEDALAQLKPSLLIGENDRDLSIYFDSL